MGKNIYFAVGENHLSLGEATHFRHFIKRDIFSFVTSKNRKED